MGCSPKPEGKALLLTTTLTYITEHRRINLVPRVEALLPLTSHSWCFNVPCDVHLMYYVMDIDINLLHFYKPSTVLSIMIHILLYQRRRVIPSTIQLQILHPTTMNCLQGWCISGINVMGIIKYILVVIKAHSMR